MSIAPHLCPKCKARVWRFRGIRDAYDLALDDRLAHRGDTPPFMAHRGPGDWVRLLVPVNEPPPTAHNGWPVHPVHHCPPPHTCRWCGNKHQPTPTRNQTIIKEN